jgi:hypothetical protein
MTTASDAVIARIRKLLALSANNPNENEAALAAEKAQELMEEYNISSLSDATTDNARSDERKQGGLYPWQRSLWEAVAKLHFCMYWSEKGLEKGAKYQHRMLGSKVNVLSATLMAEYLQDAVERMARDRVNNKGALFFTKDSIAYRTGLADRLSMRLNDKRYRKEAEARQQAANPATSNALTILNVIDAERDANDDYLYGEGYSARRRANAARWAAEHAARVAAEKARRDADPEYAARVKAMEDKANAEWERKYRARERRREQSGYYYRQRDTDTKPESYYEGYRDADSVSLDEQVSQTRAKYRIGG